MQLQFYLVCNLMKSTERSEYSYIGLADFLFFFSGKSIKICLFVNFDFSRFDLRLFLSVQCISIVKRKANYTIEQQNCKGDETRDRLLISKMETNYQISQRNKWFTY